jgi:hypothetical protein
MKVIPARISTSIILSILIIFLLIPCSTALSIRVVAAREAAAINSEAYLTSAASAAMQSPVMGCSMPSFSSPAYFGIGGGQIPVSIAVADFNQDGKPDLVTANQISNDVSVLLGNGSGSFATATTFSSGAVNPTSVAVADFNLDGKLDLAVSNISGSVSVLLGNGSGGFGAPSVLSTAGGADEVVTGDFNFDGKPDMAVARAFSNGVSIFLGNGMGGFGARTDFPAGTTCFSLRAADFNGDGKLDIATANFGSDNVSILLGNGMGSFGAPTNFPVTAGSNPRSIRAGDLDQDGDIDLVTANAATAGISVLLNNGSGSFGAATNYSTGADPRELSIGDLNGDGKPDLAVTNSGASSVSVLLGNGSGSFAAATNFSVNDSVRTVVAADLNLDGKLDLVMRSATAVSPPPSRQNVAVLLNTCSAASCSGIDFVEAAGSPYSHGLGSTADPLGAATGDFNGDGKLDIAATNFGTNNVTILLGNGVGGFTMAAGSPFAANTVPEAIVVEDFNRDGKQDLAMGNGVTPGYITVLLGNGSGGFAPAPGSPFNLIGFEGTRDITAGDFNRDGYPDIATANGFSNHVSILLNNGSGSFAQTSSLDIGTDTNPRGIIAGDFNGDGKIDLVTANSQSNNVTLMLGDGSGGFSPAAGTPTASGGTDSRHVETGDLNLDGKADLVVGNSTSHSITILLGDGNAGFTQAAGSPISGTFAPRSLVIRDFNVDGKPDIIASLSIFNDMAVLKGNGNGTFALTIADVPGAPYALAAGDYNLDGKPDLAATQLEIDSTTIFLNTCPQNSAPEITITPVSLQQTTSLNNTQIATVSDAEDDESSLAVTVDGGSNSTSNGVTVSNITVDAMGVVRADVSAACGASNASFILAVTDSQGASSSATLTVTVTPETMPPTLSCPANITQSTDAGQCSAIVSYTTPTASDNCPGATVLCSPPTGSSFTKGTTTVTCTATDVANNTAQCSFTVTVNDTENPVITCPQNITQSTDNNQCQAVVVYPKIGVTDNCENVGIPSCTPPSGSTFQKGTTTVNCSVTDAANNSGTCSFTVTINDTQNPTITCPANVTVPATTGQCQAVVNYTAPIVSDNCSGVGTPVCNPPAGSAFQKGTTTVNCSVTDAASNSNSCSFTVTVNDTQNPTVVCPANVTIASNTCVSNAYTTPTGSDNCAGVSVVCNPPASTCFAVGTTTVTCTATDAVNLTATCSFTVSIMPCTITCPANVTQNNDLNQCGAVVNYPTPTTTGSCGTVSCSPASGATFPKGTTTVTCSTTVGPSCSFTVTVNDTQAPTLTCPANIVQSTDANQCQAVVNYALPVANDNCMGVATPKCSPVSGSVFPKGVTTVNCSVGDAAGNPASCSFTVTINDTISPSLSCPSNISMNTAAGACSQVVTYKNATATDNCPGVGTPICTPSSGSTFQKGVTTVNCTVSDASNNNAICSFTVTITDNQAPSISCPSNLVRGTDAGMCSAVVSYTTPTVTDNCPGATSTCNPPSGSAFPKGVTTVNCTATDAAGLKASCSFTVTVNDTTPPVINCPANLIRILPAQCSTGSTGLTVTYSLPIATDNCSGTTVVCNPPSGTSFPLGTTTVTCTATDAASNTASCSFKVKVFDACLQDNSNAGLVIVWNTVTGEYAFCVNGQVYTGTGVITRRGCTVSLVHNTSQLRVSASVDFTMNRGNASIQSPPGSMQGSISDSDITNNSCTCSFTF